MDEALRSRRLADEILRRAESIKHHVSQVNQSMANMRLIESQSSIQMREESNLKLLDLPLDVLQKLVWTMGASGDYKSICALSQTCKQFLCMINEDVPCWKAMCEGVEGLVPRGIDPHRVPRMDTSLLRGLPGMPTLSSSLGAPYAGLMAAHAGSASMRRPFSVDTNSTDASVLHPAPGPARPCSSSGQQLSVVEPDGLEGPACSKGSGPQSTGRGGVARRGLRRDLASGRAAPLYTENIWKLVFKDRIQGRRIVMEEIQWLQAHGNPSSISGSMHRLQLQIALRYLMLFTQLPGDTLWRDLMLRLDGLRSLLALLNDDNGGIVEMALHVLANLVRDDQETKVMVVVSSRMGKLFSDRLSDSNTPGIIRDASRVLVNLWVEPPVPEVLVWTAGLAPAKPALLAGSWQLQEYSLRGESMKLFRINLVFKATDAAGVLEVQGMGHDVFDQAADAFDIFGTVNEATGAWALERTFRELQQLITYAGYSDAWGAWGVYKAQRANSSASVFMISPASQPRVFRLYRPTDVGAEI